MANVILLAEDSADDVFFFQRVLQIVGVSNPVHVVADGHEAIAYLKGEGQYSDRERYPVPCVLFLDLHMPRADGWDVLNWLAAQALRKCLLVIVVSADPRFERLQEAYSIGAHSFVIKPIQAEDLRDLIKYWPEPWMLRASPDTSSCSQLEA